jgi:hypothetical protein
MESWLNDEINITDNLFNNDLALEDELNLDNTDISIFKKLKLIKNNNDISDTFKSILTNNITQLQIKLSNLSNLDKFLDYTIVIFLYGREIYSCSIRLLSLLAEKILNLKIIKDEKYFIIPMVIFINLSRMRFSVSFTIFIMGNDKPDYKILQSNIIEKINNFVGFQIIGYASEITDYIEKYDCRIYDYTVGLIIWFTNYNDDINFLRPSIINTEFIFYKDNIKFTKILTLKKLILIVKMDILYQLIN